MIRSYMLAASFGCFTTATVAAEELIPVELKKPWQYAPDLMRPFSSRKVG